jgi:ABC-type phosphate/phosphonate transport system substrate-binding protein
MRLRLGSLLVAVALAASMVSGALAQADDDTPLSEDVSPVDTSLVPPSGAPTLFLSLADPLEQDVEVPLDTPQLMIAGTTLPGAVVSIDGNLADMDDQGNFSGVVVLDQGANEIDVVASDDQGNQVNTSVFITRGE